MIGLVAGMETGSTVRLNNLFLDAYLKYSASGVAAKSAVSIDIDEVSLESVGQWPWPRYRVASLVQAISEGESSVIGLDILFSEPDRTSLDNIQSTFKRDFGIDLSITGAPAGLLDNDGFLGYTLKSTGAVAAKFFLFDHSHNVEIDKIPEFVFTGRTDLLSLNDAPGVLDNTYKILSQTAYSGFLNNQPDKDGMLRRVPLLIQHKGHIYPHLSLVTFMRSIGVNSAEIGEDRSGPVILVGEHTIAINKKGFALLRFNGAPDLYQSISAIDVLNGTYNKADVKGKVVFVGSSATALHDLHGTIFDSQFPGLKIHNVVIENIITNGFIREPSWGQAVILIIAVITGILISVLFISMREPLWLFVYTVAIAAISFLISIYLFFFSGIFLSPLAPIVIAVFLFIVFMTIRFAIVKAHAYLWFKQLANARHVVVDAMAAVVETRDPETGAHINRTKHYVKVIAEKLRQSGYHQELLTDDYMDLLFASTPLHDLGKVGVPDIILLKPAKLDPDEMEVMKKHAIYGKEIIYSASQKIEGDNFLVVAGEIAATHHEKWDGSGYPMGLSGEAIPLSGRIMAVADVYDALISRRCYKPPFPHAQAVEIMKGERGTFFDPLILDIFLGIQSEMISIATKYNIKHEIVLGDR